MDSEPFWEQLGGGALALQRCAACAHWQFPPLERCRRCGGALALERVSGGGAITRSSSSTTRSRRASTPSAPTRSRSIALDEAPHARVPGRIVGATPGDVRVGARVQAEGRGAGGRRAPSRRFPARGSAGLVGSARWARRDSAKQRSPDAYGRHGDREHRRPRGRAAEHVRAPSAARTSCSRASIEVEGQSGLAVGRR